MKKSIPAQRFKGQLFQIEFPFLLKSPMSPDFVNISAYKFVTLDRLDDRRAEILSLANDLSLKGTVLLAHEGINLFVAGETDSIERFIEFLDARPEYQDLPIKKSPSDHQPFSRMLVRIKKEIIAFGVENVDPRQHTSRKIAATELKQWLDENREVTLLDVRNDYEVELGTFEKALPIGVDHFRDFPKAVRELPEDAKSKPLVMFCTGGIRCEKAGPFMEQEGFKQVFQLDGGILRYFEDVGGDHYDGECFVFDKRVAVSADLEETETTQCYACQHPLGPDDQKDDRYRPPLECPYCYRTPEQKMAEAIAVRQEKLADFTLKLPGSVPYDNVRPLNVPGRFDHSRLIDFLDGFHPHVGRDVWLEKIGNRLIQRDDQPVTDAEMIVRAGQRFEHLLPQSVEPDVNADIKILYEDDDLIAVQKPAPLPMHPCGRFNRNSLAYILSAVYESPHIRITHRLDANTTGVVVLARKSRVAKHLHRQFLDNLVKKIYLAKVEGCPDWDSIVNQNPISKVPGTAGSREVAADGFAAETRFEVIGRAENRSLIQCIPITGRTNQIRIHLADLGYPIVGDEIYGQNEGGDDESLKLHAASIELVHPTSGQPIRFECDPPSWSQAVV